MIKVQFYEPYFRGLGVTGRSSPVNAIIKLSLRQSDIVSSSNKGRQIDECTNIAQASYEFLKRICSTHMEALDRSFDVIPLLAVANITYLSAESSGYCVLFEFIALNSPNVSWKLVG